MESVVEVAELAQCLTKLHEGRGFSTQMLKSLPSWSFVRLQSCVQSGQRISDSGRNAIIILIEIKLLVTDPRNCRGISLLRVMYKTLVRNIVDGLIKYCEGSTRDEHAGLRPGRSCQESDQNVIAVLEANAVGYLLPIFWDSKPISTLLMKFVSPKCYVLIEYQKSSNSYLMT
ncbi:hypothetical protein RB195_007410 [Necator americanus]|uniref:Uncharacterized protein n=1 Tax=Necator americanus TaxID=51031 RepID=A0ABR1BYQ2_NECAM